MHGQAYLADSSIGRDLSPNETVKVICLPGPINRVDKAETSLAFLIHPNCRNERRMWRKAAI
jgi:hypothetical protein